MLHSLGMDWNLLLTFAAAWLLTYAIHSTLLLGAVWGLGRRAILSPALQDTLWKVALVGGLLTATWQTAGWGHAPLGGRVEVAAPASAAHPVTAPIFTFTTVRGTGTDLRVAPFGPERFGAETPPAGKRVPWEVWMLLVWGAGAALGLLRLGWARFRLARLLAGRRPLETGPLRRALDRLCREARVTRRIRLSTSDRIGGPVALAGREICLPRRAVTDLDPEQQQNALAHELAHLLRRDPAWRWTSALLEHVFFFQPLHRVARRGLKDSAEFLCDDWAVRQTGQHLTLAKCLVEVAGWLDPRPQIAPAAGMAEPGSPLVRRVERLLGARASRSREIPGGWRLAGAGVLLALVMAVAPVVTPVHERPDAAPRNASFGWTGTGDGPWTAAPLRFQGTGRGVGADSVPPAVPPERPAPPDPDRGAFGTPPAPGTPGAAPRAGARAVRGTRRTMRRDVVRLAESVVVVARPGPEPAVVCTWELPAARFRAKLAALRASLDRHRVIEADVLPALEMQVDPTVLQRMGQFLKQIEEAETLSLEVSTSLERFEPQFRMEALERVRDAERTEIQILIRELERLHDPRELHDPHDVRPPDPPAPNWIPTGSI